MDLLVGPLRPRPEMPRRVVRRGPADEDLDPRGGDPAGPLRLLGDELEQGLGPLPLVVEADDQFAPGAGDGPRQDVVPPVVHDLPVPAVSFGSSGGDRRRNAVRRLPERGAVLTRFTAYVISVGGCGLDARRAAVQTPGCAAAGLRINEAGAWMVLQWSRAARDADEFRARWEAGAERIRAAGAGVDLFTDAKDGEPPWSPAAIWPIAHDPGAYLKEDATPVDAG